MPKKIFKMDFRVYLGETNLFGNVYFANYFHWQGVAREEFFRQLIPDPLFFVKQNLKLVTIEAFVHFLKEATLYDEIEVTVNPGEVKAVTLQLAFNYINKKTGEALAEGRQKIGFVNSANAVVPIPNELLLKGMDYL